MARKQQSSADSLERVPMQMSVPVMAMSSFMMSLLALRV